MVGMNNETPSVQYPCLGAFEGLAVIVSPAPDIQGLQTTVTSELLGELTVISPKDIPPRSVAYLSPNGKLYTSTSSQGEFCIYPVVGKQ
jgi:hypothetical protein